jgi:hypothetical protein
MTNYTHEEKLIALESKSFGEYLRRYLSEIGDPPNECRIFCLWKARKHSIWPEKEVIEG